MTNRTVLLAAAADNVLRALGVEVAQTHLQPLAARSWGSVSEHLGQTPIAAAIVHYQLADVNGEKFCQLFRSQPGRDKLPIILLWPDFGGEVGPGSPYDAVVRFPCGPGVLADVLTSLVARGSQKMLQIVNALRDDLRARMESLDNKSYYDLLGIRATDSRSAITKAYDSLSLRFHPDQLKMFEEDAALVESAQQFYMLISEAYQVLLNPSMRRKYDSLLERGQLRYDFTGSERIVDLPSLSKVPNAKRYLRLAQEEMGRKNKKAAATFLEMAKAVDPDNKEIMRLIEEL